MVLVFLEKIVIVNKWKQSLLCKYLWVLVVSKKIKPLLPLYPFPFAFNKGGKVTALIVQIQDSDLPPLLIGRLILL